jgi:hypothetical protein
MAAVSCVMKVQSLIVSSVFASMVGRKRVGQSGLSFCENAHLIFLFAALVRGLSTPMWNGFSHSEEERHSLLIHELGFALLVVRGCKYTNVLDMDFRSRGNAIMEIGDINRFDWNVTTTINKVACRRSILLISSIVSSNAPRHRRNSSMFPANLESLSLVHLSCPLLVCMIA